MLNPLTCDVMLEKLSFKKEIIKYYRSCLPYFYKNHNELLLFSSIDKYLMVIAFTFSVASSNFLYLTEYGIFCNSEHNEIIISFYMLETG